MRSAYSPRFTVKGTPQKLCRDSHPAWLPPALAFPMKMCCLPHPQRPSCGPAPVMVPTLGPALLSAGTDERTSPGSLRGALLPPRFSDSDKLGCGEGVAEGDLPAVRHLLCDTCFTPSLTSRHSGVLRGWHLTGIIGKVSLVLNEVILN